MTLIDLSVCRTIKLTYLCRGRFACCGRCFCRSFRCCRSRFGFCRRFCSGCGRFWRHCRFCSSRRRFCIVIKSHQIKSNERFVVRSIQRNRGLLRITTINKNLAIANRSRVSCAHNTLRASIGLNITVTLKSRLRVTQGHW